MVTAINTFQFKIQQVLNIITFPKAFTLLLLLLKNEHVSLEQCYNFITSFVLYLLILIYE